MIEVYIELGMESLGQGETINIRLREQSIEEDDMPEERDKTASSKVFHGGREEEMLMMFSAREASLSKSSYSLSSIWKNGSLVAATGPRGGRAVLWRSCTRVRGRLPPTGDICGETRLLASSHEILCSESTLVSGARAKSKSL